MRVSPKLLAFEILAFLVFAVLAGAGFLAWRLSQGPIDLELVRPQVERSLSEARGGQPVKIENVVLEWERNRNRVEAVARGLTALDDKNQVIFRADRAAIALDAGALMSGKFKTRQLRLENGTANVVRSKDGVWSLADIVFAREPATNKPFDPFKDLNWATLATPIRALISAGSFERVELVNFNFTVNDQKAGSVWSANPVGGEWSAGPDGVALDLDVKLAGAAEPNRIRISLASDGAVTKATGALTLEGVDPISIAEVFGYTGDDFSSGMPANAVFTVEATEAGGLRSTRISLKNITGRGRLGDRDISIGGLGFDAVYDPSTKQVKLESLKISSDVLTGEFTGTLDATSLVAGDTARPTPFKISGNDFSLALTPMFEEAWPFASADIEGNFASDMQHLNVTKLHAVTGQATVNGAGEFWLEGPPEARQLGAKVTAVAEGAITPQQVTAFWPVNLGAGARIWVKNRIPSGTATKAVYRMDWPPGANSRGYLDNEVLTLDFTVQGAAIKFLDDFPAVTNVTGTGHLEGNSLTVNVTGGAMNSWLVDEAKIDMPRFAPKGGTMDVRVMGRGDLGQLMRVLDASNLKVGSKYGLQVDQMTGSGGIDIHMQRPMLDHVPDNEILYEIKGGFREAAAPNIAAGFGLTSSDVTFEITQNGMSIAGAGQFGPAPVVFDWKERFALSGSTGSELKASARVTPDLLNAFGFAARNIMQGEAAVELEASGTGGRDFTSMTASVDLTRSQLELSELGWRKKYDAPAQGSFRYGKDSKGALITGDIRADGLELTGEARMDAAGAFESANIERIFSRDSVDLRGNVSRKPDGGYRINIAGPFFDASPFMDSLLSMSESAKTDMHGEPTGGPSDPGPAIDIQLAADKLRLRENADLTAAKVNMSIDANGPRNGTITGQIDKDKKLDVAITSQGDARRIVINSDDAGFGARVLLKLDYLIGGKLRMDGTFTGASGDAMVHMTDVRLTEAPLVAQIFSLASLRGLADVLNGDGVLFTQVDAPIKLQNGRIDLPGLRASGPAMGITARGWIAPGEKELSLDGVLVPSFGVNSFLGGLPIIGDLFVSRQGEGMFAPTYSVRGTFSKARVSLNPVSAITPGVLRRIFENPAEPPPVAEAAPEKDAQAKN
ncbi:MAG: DUF3971 domain-containing protein [Hyphomonadaceae bacterium]|nr:DUF3971 domain-containing protein [Hyphomonadaceae bacterium]